VVSFPLRTSRGSGVVDANLTEFGPGKTYPTWIAWTESREFRMLAASVGPARRVSIRLPSHNDAGIDLGASGKLAVEGGVGVRCHVLHLRDAIGDHITNAMW